MQSSGHRGAPGGDEKQVRSVGGRVSAWAVLDRSAARSVQPVRGHEGGPHGPLGVHQTLALG